MPITRIELTGKRSMEDKEKPADIVHRSMVEALKIPEHDRLIRIVEYEEGNFFCPGCSDAEKT